MLERPHSRRRIEARRQRDARYRQRLRDGKVVASVEIDGEVIGLLLRTGWLLERDAGNSRAIGAAIARMLAVSVRCPGDGPLSAVF